MAELAFDLQRFAVELLGFIQVAAGSGDQVALPLAIGVALSGPCNCENEKRHSYDYACRPKDDPGQFARI